MANGLINLQTDLKSLRYGSSTPYITKDINKPPSSNQIGIQASKRIDDTSRIAQMLASKPGLKYLANEALLRQTNIQDTITKAQKNGKSTVGAILQQVGNTLLSTVKIVGSTLAQVPVNGTGTHFLKGFRTDTYLKPTNQSSANAFTRFFGAGGVEGAQYALRGEVVPGEHRTELTTNTRSSNFDYVGGDVFLDRNEQLNTPLSENDLKRQNKLNAEFGSPVTVIPSGSSVRETTIRDYDESGISANLVDPGTYQDNIDPNNANNPANPLQETRLDNFDTTLTYTKLQESKKVGTAGNLNITKESRVGLGTQGKKRSSYVNYMDVDTLMQDKVNILDILSSTQQQTANLGDGRDLAKFYFEIITPEGSNFLHFRAFIDSVDDSYSADWQARKYNGRAENFYTYGGFDRDISVSFNIAAASRKEMAPLYKKMVYLASATAPTYGASGLMRGTLAKLTIGSYFSQIPGVLTSVKYSIDNNIPWEIALSNPDGGAGNNTDDDVQELPMMLKCSITFKPIHNFAPQTGLYHYFTSKDGVNGGKPFFKEEEPDFTKTAAQKTVLAQPSTQQPIQPAQKIALKEQTALDKAVASSKAAKTTATKRTTTAAVQGAKTALKNAQKGENWKNNGGLSPQQIAQLKARGK